jgi:hypothetical protein
MTPFQEQSAAQASTETVSTRLFILVGELCRAVDIEREDNRLSRLGCKRDCQEHRQIHARPPALAENVTGAVGCS